MPFLHGAPLPAPLRQVTLWGPEMALIVTPIAPGASQEPSW